MRTSTLQWAIVSVLLLHAPGVQAASAATAPVPVAPISAIEYLGWSGAYRLRNDEIQVVIVPEIGRIVHIGFLEGENLLRLDEHLHGRTGAAAEPGEWLNFGGDWLWPVAQSRWSDFQEGIWPPSPFLDGRPWSGRAWRTEDGSQHCLISRDFGAPLHVRVSRTIRLDPTNMHISVRQRIERLESSDIPVTLWHLSQVQDAEQVVIPVENDSRFEKGITSLMFDTPKKNMLYYGQETVVYQAQRGGEHKLGSDSPRAWLAALKGRTLLVAQATPGEGQGIYPDGGCTVQLYSNTGLGYAELETLSTEQVLEPGEHINNTITLALFRLDPVPETSANLADAVQRLLGEPPLTPAQSEPEEEHEEPEEQENRLPVGPE